MQLSESLPDKQGKERKVIGQETSRRKDIRSRRHRKVRGAGLVQEAAVQGLALLKEMELTTQGTWTQAFEKWRAFFFLVCVGASNDFFN